MRIVVDAMGGDHAPLEIVKGCLVAAEQSPDISLILVGQEDKIKSIIGSNQPKNITVINAPEVIEMHESPVAAIRSKRKSSLVQSAKLVGMKEADVFVSAGNTGAAVASSIFLLGFLEGVKRPGIAVPIPTAKGPSYLIDAGANIDCHPIHLLQYGIMASVYCKKMQNITTPRVGLLNIGEEDSKGNQLVQETLALFKKAPINFIGNIEGQDIFKGNCEVVVCEGFVGNVVLKLVEGCYEFFGRSLMTEAGKHKDNSQCGNFMNSALGAVTARLDYSEYGGAPLLGVNGGCIICHGRSKAKAITNAVKVAATFGKQKVNEEILKEINSLQLSWLDLLKSWKTHR
ncbi:MAG: phosphate acyltransferase PlsX [Planctomycetota bacterium]